MTFGAPAGEWNGSTMLVVEDDEVVAGLLCHLLEEEGLSVTGARTAEEGWRAVVAESPQSAVIDIRLPGRDGWWLVAQIRGEEEAGRHMPVVMITGFLDAEVEQRAEQWGCAWLGKPFTLDDLAEKLRLANRLAGALPAQADNGEFHSL